MREYVVIIPAYRPEKELIPYVEKLLQNEVAHVIVVDDGNGEKTTELFSQLNQYERCTVLHHETNRGKGAALKTAFSHYLEYYSDMQGVITADADGQHLIHDVLNVGTHLSRIDEGFVLGARNFDRSEMPIRSYIGNTFTSRIFQLLFGTYVSDTQTGLRGVTTKELSWVSQLHGNHFDFEMNMLVAMIRKKCRIIRVDIEAFYAEEHTSTFHTYKDSLKIANLIAKEFLSNS